MSLDWIIGVLVVINLMGMSIAAYVVMKRK